MKNITIIIFLFSVVFCQAQQDSYRWRIGAHGGVMTYYGDLSKSYFDWQQPWVSPFDNLDKVTYGLSIENNFSKTFSWKIAATQGSFQAYDRAIDRDGDFLTTVENFNRGLNVQTDVRNLAFTFQFYTDNDWLLSEKAFVAPFFSIGAGITQFTPYADLFLENGDRYFYWSDGTIWNVHELSVPPSATRLERDHIYETNLTEIQTEQVDYATTTLSFPVGIGLKFRLSDRLNLNLEAQGQYTMTDYLDDVSGDYPTNFDSPLQAYASQPGTSSTTSRGTNSNLNDIFGTIIISAHYSFGYKMEAFLPPTLYTIDATEMSDVVVNRAEDLDSLKIILGGITADGMDGKPIKIVTKGEANTFSNEDTTITIETEEDNVQEKEVIVLIDNTETIDTSKNVIVTVIEDEENTNDKKNNVTATTVNRLDTTITIIKTKTDTTVLVVIEEEEEPIKNDEIIVSTTVTTENKTKENPRTTPLTGVEIVDLDGNPVLPDTTTELVVVPNVTQSDSTVSLSVVPDDDEPASDFLKTLENIKSEVDSSTVEPLEINEPTIDLSDLNLVDSTSLNAENENPALLLGIEKTRADVAQLSLQFNQLLKEREADKTEIAALHQKLDSLTKILVNAQDYNNNVAIRANNDYNQPDNVKIRNSSNELEKELEILREQLERADEDYKKALAYANKQEQENQKTINQLNQKIRILNAQVKEEKKKNKPKTIKSEEPKVWNPSRADDGSTDSTVIIDTIKTTVVLEDDTIKTTEPLVEANDLQATFDSIVAEYEVQNARVIAEKEREISALLEKMERLEKELVTSKVEKEKSEANNINANDKNEIALKALESKIDELNSKISNLEKAEPKVITVEKPVEKIVEKPVEKIVEQPADAETDLTVMLNAIKGYEKTNIYFRSGKSTIDQEFNQRLEQLANLMLLYPDLRATVTGYADKSGNPEINFRLSRQRSEAVQKFFLQQGIRTDRIRVNYLGETTATKANDPFARRVEIIIIH